MGTKGSGTSQKETGERKRGQHANQGMIGKMREHQSLGEDVEDMDETRRQSSTPLGSTEPMGSSPTWSDEDEADDAEQDENSRDARKLHSYKDRGREYDQGRPDLSTDFTPDG